jgi:hypothetical protein
LGDRFLIGVLEVGQVCILECRPQGYRCSGTEFVRLAAALYDREQRARKVVRARGEFSRQLRREKAV